MRVHGEEGVAGEDVIGAEAGSSSRRREVLGELPLARHSAQQ